MNKRICQLISNTYKSARVVGRGGVKIDPSEVSSTEEFKQAKKKAKDIVEAERPKLRVSDVGVISVDSNELARSEAGQKQIEALRRLLGKKEKKDER